MPENSQPSGNVSSGAGPCDEAAADDARTDQPGTFEQSLAELESIVHQLEDGQIGLAEALARYEQGVRHLKHCYQLLERAERKIELLTGVADDGTPITEPLVTEAAGLEESAGRRRTRRASAPRQRDIDAPGPGF